MIICRYNGTCGYTLKIYSKTDKINPFFCANINNLFMLCILRDICKSCHLYTIIIKRQLKCIAFHVVDTVSVQSIHEE